VITRAGFGDRVAFTDAVDGWLAGTLGRVRLARADVALIEILDPDDHTLDLVEVPYEVLRVVSSDRKRLRRVPVFGSRLRESDEAVSEGRGDATRSDLRT
jgi:hypothetical protein